MSDLSRSRLLNLLALLRAAQLVHHTAHWQTRGATFYADHQLFARLYGDVLEEADGLAEKLVYLLGPEAVDALDQVVRLHAAVRKAVEVSPDLVQRSYALEMSLQAAIAAAREGLAAEGKLPLGLDNYLAGLADAHETACYLLRQRSER